MKKIGILALDSFLENVQSRVFVLILIFGGILFYFSLIFGSLAADREVRVLMDVGLALIETIALVAALYEASTLFLREIETKTIYLILARPLTRLHYLLGRFLGLILSFGLVIIVMASLHTALLLSQHWIWQSSYLFSLLGIFLSVLLMTTLAIFCALFSTSSIAAIVFSGSLWALGHFISEMRFMALESVGIKAFLIKIIIYVIPNFQILNWKNSGLHPAFIWQGFAYSLSYSAVCLSMSWILLRKKEF